MMFIVDIYVNVCAVFIVGILFKRMSKFSLLARLFLNINIF